MARTQSPITTEALKLLGTPKPGGGVWDAYALAAKFKMNPSSLYRAAARHGKTFGPPGRKKNVEYRQKREVEFDPIEPENYYEEPDYREIRALLEL